MTNTMKLVLLLGTVSLTLGLSIPQNRIINGQEATPGQFPYQVSLQQNIFEQYWFHFCGGSILNQHYILTAGHCVDNNTQIHVTVGDHDITDDDKYDERILVKEQIVHEDFTLSGIATNDIGVLRLDKTIEFNRRVRGTTLTVSAFDTTNLTCIVSGWGVTEEGIAATRLRYVEVDNYPLRKCQREWFWSVTEANVCSKNPGDAMYGPCSVSLFSCSWKPPTNRELGDSGGPYICEHQGERKQIGIVSWGVGDCATNLPAVYTSVLYYKDWIQQYA